MAKKTVDKKPDTCLETVWYDGENGFGNRLELEISDNIVTVAIGNGMDKEYASIPLLRLRHMLDFLDREQGN